MPRIFFLETANLNATLPSNKKFGWFFSVIFFLCFGYLYWNTYFLFSYFVLIISISFATITFFSPKFLTSLNYLWYRFGLLLGLIISPIVLGIIFFALITPVSLIIRLFGRDVLQLKNKKISVSSYWVDRDPKGIHPDSFKDQF